VTPALASAAAAASALRSIGGAVARRLHPARVGVALGMLLPMVLIAAGISPVFSASPPTVLARLAATTFTALVILLAVVVADELVDRGLPALRTYALAVILGALSGAAVGVPLRHALGWNWGHASRVSAEALQRFERWHQLDQALLGLLVGGLATSVHVSRRTALAARRRQHASERARAAAAQRTLESQLQALQARVEPMFLFRTLERIRTLYRADAAAAAAMLEDLITYLRAALPHLRESTSTVGQELTLARAWLDIAGRGATRWRVQVLADPAARDARLPALLLLPLVQHLVGGTLDGLDLQLTAWVHGRRLALDLTASGGSDTPPRPDHESDADADADLLPAPVRERLERLFHGEARLGFATNASTPPTRRIRIEVPRAGGRGAPDADQAVRPPPLHGAHP